MEKCILEDNTSIKIERKKVREGEYVQRAIGKPITVHLKKFNI